MKDAITSSLRVTEPCKICGNGEKNLIYKIKERQINKGEVFRYLYCSHCGTLQLYDEIDDIGNYYPNDYYSFHMKGRGLQRFLPMIIKKDFTYFISNSPVELPSILENILRDIMGSLMQVYGTHVKLESAILDVGGGNGKWLYALYRWGFRNLTCIDLFAHNSFHGIKHMQCDIKDVSDDTQYDLIAFHHSFEHMPDPELVLRKVKNILSPTGVCLIRIPICECKAWDIYHENWYEIDAPRHYYLYTERALRILCERVGLQICRIVYDSKPGQFIISEKYKSTDLSLGEIEQKIKWKRIVFRIGAWRINKLGQGDRAAFYVKHRDAV